MNNTTQSISADTFFHFTKSMKIIRLILKNGFRSSYCREKIPFEDFSEKTEFVLPMVCFCDLPLSLTKSHIKKYGGLGIGMKKRWGLNIGMSPIHYLHSEATAAKKLDKAFKYLNEYANSFTDQFGARGDLILMAKVELTHQLHYIKGTSKNHDSAR